MKFAIILVAQLVWLGCVHGALKLGSYNVDKSQITLSGISSGAVMAIQFHFAHSSEILGAGVFAGAPYLCGLQGVAAASTCMLTPALVNVAALILETNTLAATGQIDSPANLVGSPVYVFHGQKDTVVYPASGRNIEEMYNHYGANVKTEFALEAHHGQITDNYGAACSDPSDRFEFFNNCNFKGAFELLNHLYGGNLIRPTYKVELAGDFYEFDQSEFFYISPPSFSSMDTVGYAYIPSGCMDKSTSCRFHIAFHGCLMNRDRIGDAYPKKSGYLEAAELNNIIMIFPQTITTLPNPNACWDWWGYVNSFYPTKEGNQILAVQRMLKRVTG